MRFPASTLLFCLMITGPVLTIAGCAPAARPKPAARVLAGSRIVGEVAVVDEEKHFVLIDLESNLYVPAPGTALETRSATKPAAHLRASPEQKRPFIAADIIDGEPAVGDQVVR